MATDHGSTRSARGGGTVRCAGNSFAVKTAPLIFLGRRPAGRCNGPLYFDLFHLDSL